MRKCLFIVLLAMAGPCFGQATQEGKPSTLFSIKDNAVYSDEFIRLYKKNHLKKEEFSIKSVDEYLALFINFKLKVTEARACGLDTTDVFKKEFKSYNAELRKPYLAEKSEVDRLTQEAYKRLTEEVKASHLLVSVKPDATPADTLKAFSKISQFRLRVKNGESFEKLAKEFSEDPSAKSNGGNIGYFTVLQMVYPFEQAAYTLPVGEVSQPVRTRFGYHLIKVTDHRPARGEVEVSHIILRTDAGDATKMRNKILDIYDQLQGGRSWDELCREYSDDPSTKETGGRLRPFGIGAMAGVPEFESVAFSLKTPGEISDPFQTAYGWHIVRLERKLPVPPFSEVESSLQRKVSRDERVEIANRKFQEQKKKDFGFTENAETKITLLDRADSSLQKGQWKFRGDNSLRAKVLFTMHDKSYSANDLILFIEKNQSSNAMSPLGYMNQLYIQFVDEKIEEIEDAKLFSENEEYRNLLNEYRDGILLFTIMEKEVWNKSSEDSVNLRKYYETHLSKYATGERVRAKVLASTDKAAFEEVLKKVSNGDSIRKNDLTKFKIVQPVRNFQRGDNKAVDKVSWIVGVQNVHVDETYYLVEIEKLLPAGTKTFDEARAQVVSDFQEVLEKKWVSELKLKYPVKINNKGKKFVYKELTEK